MGVKPTWPCVELPLGGGHRRHGVLQSQTERGQCAECCEGTGLGLWQGCKFWGCLWTFQGGFGPVLLLFSAREPPQTPGLTLPLSLRTVPLAGLEEEGECGRLSVPGKSLSSGPDSG